MDGLGLRFRKGFDAYFKQDKFGSFIPSSDNLHMDIAREKVQRQLSADTGLARRMSDIYYRTDVEFTDNPLGNTHVIGAGVKLFGARPLKKKSFNDRLNILSKRDNTTEKQLRARERRIENFQSNVLALHKRAKDAVNSDSMDLIWQVEGDQAMTGGGFDNNKVGEVHKAALKFVTKSSATIDYEDSVLSQLVVEGALELRDYLAQKGLRLGSLKPTGIRAVRFNQDNDGMMGFPLLIKSQAALTKDLATRLLIESGVDTRSFVGSTVTDKFTGMQYSYRVVDAVGYVLDRSILGPTDLISLVILLARIQKHGWKFEGSDFIAKPGKTRAVYPNAAIPGAIEAMTFTAFNDALQELQVDIMPSLQTKEVRSKMVWDALNTAISHGYDYLAADWSQYDATVKGAILATVIQLAVKPFYNSKYYDWVDASTYILTHKYLITDEALDRINVEDFNEANKSAKNVRVDRYIIYGLVDGLISGAKFTHVGGSLYGEVVIHRCLPRLCKHEPIFGAQAGDDTLLGWPRDYIFTDSVERTYTPVAEAAKRFGLDINPSKQIWHQYNGEVVKVFLQEVYQHNLDIRGTGSIFRPYDAVFFSEHDRGLSIPEQEMATISRMNQGADNPFVKIVVEDWLKHDELIGALFKEYGEDVFKVLVKASGIDSAEIFKSIHVGSFDFGIDRDAATVGNIPILKIAAEVAKNMSFSMSPQDALSRLDSDYLKDEASSETPTDDISDDEMLADQTD